MTFFNSHPSTPHLERKKKNKPTKERVKNITTELGDLSIRDRITCFSNYVKPLCVCAGADTCVCRRFRGSSLFQRSSHLCYWCFQSVQVQRMRAGNAVCSCTPGL